MNKPTSIHHGLNRKLAILVILAAIVGLIVASPAAIAAAPTEYFIDDGGQPAGPFDLDQLRQRHAAGNLTTDTLAWTEGMAGWQPAGQIPALAGLFRSAPPPMPGLPTSPGQPGGQASIPPAPTPMLQRDISEFLIGKWQTRGQFPVEGYGPSDAEISSTFHNDGSFEWVGQYRVHEPGVGVVPIDIRVEGQWASPVSDRSDNNDLRGGLVTLNGNMTMSLPAEFGIPSETEPFNERQRIHIIDENSLRDDDELVWQRQR